MTPDAGDRIARLYGLPLDQFTTARNALAAELRSEGNGEAATAVKALRKPSAAAWAVNQLVRAEPELVEALLGAGGELRQAHRQAASGKGAAQLRVAADAERAAVDQLMARAAMTLGREPSAALAESMRNTLHATSSDDEARERVASGTLVGEMRPVGLGPVPAALAGGGGRRKKPADDAEERAARERAAEHARELGAATAAEAALARELDAATRALDRAEESYARAREAADTAAERLKEARKRLREARAGLREAANRRSQLERG
jgi:exonuclease VII small subunit